MAPPVEPIPDDDTVCRLVDKPSMYSEQKGIIWPTLFQFPRDKNNPNEDPTNLHESLVWSKYAAPPDAVHAIGCQRQAKKLGDFPESKMRYIGFISTTAKRIRAVVNARNHGFNVDHDPIDGAVYHAKISFRIADGVPLLPNDKSELKFKLSEGVFDALVSHTCAA